MRAHHIYYGAERGGDDGERGAHSLRDALKGSCLGPEYGETDFLPVARKYGMAWRKLEGAGLLADETAKLIAAGQVIGWFQGRAEFGPRALGCRSILADARNPEMQKKLNLSIKNREGFRPFAPAVLVEDVHEYFELEGPSPYMLLVRKVRKSRQLPLPADFAARGWADKLYWQRSDLPAITHIDYSARIQTVDRETNPRFWQLLRAFRELTGCAVLINTSFNVRDEPIVNTPEDAFRCFIQTEMDYLVMCEYIFSKTSYLA